MSRHIASYHLRLFEWHCAHFHPLAKALLRSEIDYLNACFALPRGYRETSKHGHADLSYYTYSHRIDGDRVNSSRFAFGSVASPEPCLAAATPVFRERGIDVEELFPGHRAMSFYGLGWDQLERHFKIYFRVPDISSIPDVFRSLLPNGCHQENEGLLSVTLRDGDLVDRKVYLYGEPGSPRVEMCTSSRSIVEQCDVTDVDPWRKRISAPGRAILGRYEEIDETLDTIAFTDENHYTLYFP